MAVPGRNRNGRFGANGAGNLPAYHHGPLRAINVGGLGRPNTRDQRGDELTGRHDPDQGVTKRKPF